MHPTTSTILITPFLHLPRSATSSFLNQSPSCFLRLISFILLSAESVYVLHPLQVPLPFITNLPQVALKHDNITF